MQPGDVVVFKGKLQHHALVLEIDRAKQRLITIDGNGWCQVRSVLSGIVCECANERCDTTDTQSIAVNSHKMCEIQGYYSLANAGKSNKERLACQWPNGFKNCPATPAEGKGAGKVPGKVPGKGPAVGPGQTPAPGKVGPTTRKVQVGRVESAKTSLTPVVRAGHSGPQEALIDVHMGT